MKIYTRLENETDEQLLFRMGSEKEITGMTWQEIADTMNKITNQHFDESAYRKKYNSFSKMFNANHSSLYEDEYVKLIEEKEKKLYKQQVKTQDALREYRANLRQEARHEVLVEAIKNNATEFEPQITEYKGNTEGVTKAVLCISDWHIGTECYNFYNSYNLNIFADRLNTLIQKTIKYCQRNKVKELTVLNLGDLINNSIHISARVQNEINAIEQTHIAQKSVYYLLVSLSQHIEQVCYSSVVDNHSRINMNYKDHIEAESYGKLIDYWLQDRIEFYNEKNKGLINPIKIWSFDKVDDTFDFMQVETDKITQNIFYQHGHLGSTNTVSQDLAFGTKVVPDVILLGHWHNFKIKNFQGCKVLVNGSMVGVDDFALNHRLFEKPSQNLIIFDEEEMIPIPLVLG